MKTIIESRIKEMDRNISKFKQETNEFTEWKTGYHILDYVDTRKAFEYGKMIGKRDCLIELLHLINAPTINGEQINKTGGRPNDKQ